jgi:hypothetical protein
MMFPTVMAKGVVAQMAPGCRATAMLDGERAGDGLACLRGPEPEPESQRLPCYTLKALQTAYVVAAPITRKYKSRDLVRELFSPSTSLPLRFFDRSQKTALSECGKTRDCWPALLIPFL